MFIQEIKNKIRTCNYNFQPVFQELYDNGVTIIYDTLYWKNEKFQNVDLGMSEAIYRLFLLAYSYYVEIHDLNDLISLPEESSKQSSITPKQEEREQKSIITIKRRNFIKF